MKNKKVWIFVGIALVLAAAAWFFFIRKKKAAPGAPVKMAIVTPPAKK